MLLAACTLHSRQVMVDCCSASNTDEACLGAQSLPGIHKLLVAFHWSRKSSIKCDCLLSMDLPSLPTGM